MYGDLKANPVFKVTAITHRRDAVFQLLQMPWENAWLGAAATEAQVWNVLKTAGVDVVNVAVTEGSACRWSVIASIRKRAGGGKNALMAILALPDTKHAIVVDEDVDIHDPTQVEWARTFYELVRELPEVEYRTVLQAWGALRERRVLGRDEHGRYRIRPS